MTELLATWGLAGLFLGALLAGSVVPVPSEPILVSLLLQGFDPGWAILVAVLGNSLGAATLFGLGRLVQRPGQRILERTLLRLVRPTPVQLERGTTWVRRWGSPILLLSWVPFLGDVLVFAAGSLQLDWRPCAGFVITGKTLRFLAVAMSVLALG